MRRLRTAVLVFIQVGAACLGARSVEAQSDPPAVAITVDACVPVDHDKLNQLLAIELGDARIGAEGATTRVVIDCATRGIRLRVDDLLTRKSMQRMLPARSFADASSTRLLALATAEFVVASWIELSVRRPTTLALNPPAAGAARQQHAAQRLANSRAVAAVEAAPSEVTTLSAALLTRVWTEQGTAFIGGAVRWLRDVGPNLALSAAIDFGSADTRVNAGDVSAITTSLALAVSLHARIDRFDFFTGPGAALGLTSLQGRATDTRVVGYRILAPYGGALWFNRVAYRASSRVLVALDLEAGLTTLPVLGTAPADGASGPFGNAFALDGVSLAASAGVGFIL